MNLSLNPNTQVIYLLVLTDGTEEFAHYSEDLKFMKAQAIARDATLWAEGAGRRVSHIVKRTMTRLIVDERMDVTLLESYE